MKKAGQLARNEERENTKKINITIGTKIIYIIVEQQITLLTFCQPKNLKINVIPPTGAEPTGADVH